MSKSLCKNKVDKRLWLLPIVLPLLPVSILGMVAAYTWSAFLIGFELIDALFCGLHTKINEMKRGSK